MAKVTYQLISANSNHEINPEVVINPYILDVLKGKHVIPITHVLQPGTPKKFTDADRFLDLTNQKKYERRTYEYKPMLHWGQLKLFLSEVEFLTKVYALNQQEIWFVYAGAAPGQHIKFLAKLFPKIHFELYDPNKFSVEDTNMIKTHVQFFTDDDAEYWAKQAKEKFVVFCSDIRTEPATPENVVRNMGMQMKWWNIIKPELSMFKFRLPWEAGKTEYPDGEIYVQAYPGPTSSETRLIVKKDANTKLYDNELYENACYYHNIETRLGKYKTVLGNLSLVRDGVDMCFDCSSFINIMQNYLIVLDLPLTGLRQLLMDVQREISFGNGNVLSHSIKQFSESLDTLSKSTYKKCANSQCQVCLSGIKFKNLKSKATIENEINQQKKKVDL